jgi:hypothetical protein
LPDLATLQSDFVRAVLGPDRAAAISAIDDDAGSAELRLAVHRNTVLSGLCDALRLSYPVTERVLGTEFFDQSALAFVRLSPPREPVLARYGDGFPDFLKSLSALADLPYVPDLARLEWIADQAGLGSRRRGCGFGLVVSGGTATVIIDPSLCLFESATTVRPLWDAVRSGDDEALAAIDWRRGPERLAIFRKGAEIVAAPLSLPAWSVLAALLDGKDLPAAIAVLGSVEEIDENELARELLAAPFVRIELDHSSRIA